MLGPGPEADASAIEQELKTAVKSEEPVVYKEREQTRTSWFPYTTYGKRSMQEQFTENTEVGHSPKSGH